MLAPAGHTLLDRAASTPDRRCPAGPEASVLGGLLQAHLTELLMSPVWELVLFSLCSLISGACLRLTELTGSSSLSCFQNLDVSSLDFSPCQRISVRATRARRSSFTQPRLWTRRYWTRITRRCPPSAMLSMPAFSSSRAWEPRRP